MGDLLLDRGQRRELWGRDQHPVLFADEARLDEEALAALHIVEWVHPAAGVTRVRVMNSVHGVAVGVELTGDLPGTADQMRGREAVDAGPRRPIINRGAHP